MTYTINNDRQLRQAIDTLSIDEQRRLGALFVAHVAHLGKHQTITEGLKVAADSDRTEGELGEAYRKAKKFSVDSYTACGSDADWMAQAEHFVATAVSACLAPEEQFALRENPAWRAAMQCRMAKNCEMIASDSGEEQGESDRQYQIAMEFLT